MEDLKNTSDETRLVGIIETYKDSKVRQCFCLFLLEKIVAHSFVYCMSHITVSCYFLSDTYFFWGGGEVIKVIHGESNQPALFPKTFFPFGYS